MFKILEISWLAIGVIGMALAAYKYTTEGFDDALWFLILTFVAGIMYSIRRRQRINMEKHNNKS